MQISFFFNTKLRFVFKLIIYFAVSVLISLEFPFEHLIFICTISLYLNLRCVEYECKCLAFRYLPLFGTYRQDTSFAV